MAKTQAAIEAEQKKKQEEESSLKAMLAEAVGPLQQEIAALKAQTEEAAQSKMAQAEAERKAQLAADADLKGMLEGSGDEADDDDKFDKMSNRKLIEVVCSAVDAAIGANSEKLKDELSGIVKTGEGRVDKIQQAVMAVVAKIGIDETKKKFGDFDNYKEEIAVVMGKYPGIDFDHAYFIAKSEKAGKVPPKSAVETEKPTNYGAVPVAGAGAVPPGDNAMAIMAARGRDAREQGGAPKSGVIGFRTFVNEAAEKVISD